MMLAEAPPVTGFDLRPYQQECLDAINERAGVKRQLVSLPTGTGKTVVFAHLLAERGGRSLVLGHRDELIRQAVDKITLVDPNLDVGVVKAGENEVNAQVIVASVQTLSRPNRLEMLPNDIGTVIVDEAHHAVADTYKDILGYVGSFDPNGPLTVGFTATPMRGDGAGLGGVFEEIVYQKNLVDMILEGWLADLRAVRVKIDINLDKVHTRGGDFIDSELEDALEQANAPLHVVSAYRTHAPGRKALVFTPGVKSAHEMADAFQDAGISAETLDGATPIEERRAILERFHTGETMVVSNCAVLTEGFDEPSVDCIIVARPTRSKTLYIQEIGRGTRTYPGKADCLVIDVVGATSKHTIMSSAELFDLDLKKATVREAVQERTDSPGKVQVSGELVASCVNLFADRSLHWQRTKTGAWILSLGDSFLRLVPQADDRWEIHRVAGKEHQRVRDNLPLDYAQGIAESIARKEGTLTLVDPNARWRTHLATSKQMAYLAKKRIAVPTGLTKGAASDLIATVVGDR